jgi:hypothetical protein
MPKFDILGFGLSSVALMILAKTRLVMTTSCCSMSYNDHNVDVHKLHQQDDEKQDDDDYQDVPLDSFKAIPVPSYSRNKPIGVMENLQMLNR